MSDETCPICRMPKDTCAVGACPGALRGGFKLPYEFDPAELAKYQIQGGFQRGDRIAFQYLDGPIHVGTVQDMTYTSGTPAIYPTLTRWQRITRRLTPRRWRKPIKPIHEATLPEMTITATQFDDVNAWPGKTIALADEPQPTGTVIDGIIKTEPGEPK